MNIKKYYWYQFFNELMPIYPLYLLLFESKGLTLSQISLLLAVWSVPVVLLEIPTGILADHFSRKNLMFLSGVLKAACYVVWIFSNGLYAYAVGFVLWGISSALGSGTEEALLYDSLKIDGKEGGFDRILGKGRFFSGVSTIIAALAGGYIGKEYGFPVALYLSVLSGLIAAAIAFSMKDVNLYKEHLNKEEIKKEAGTFRGALAFLLGSREILLFSLLSLLVITTAGVLDEYDQLVAEEFGLSLKLIGAWVAVRFILISFGGYIAYGLRTVTEKLFRIKDRMYTISILCLFAAVFLILAGVIRHLGVMPLYGVFYLIMAASDVLREDYIQQKIVLEGRSTIHSVLSLAENLYGILCFSMFGFIATNTGLFSGLAWCGVYLIIWIILLTNLYKRVHSKHERL